MKRAPPCDAPSIMMRDPGRICTCRYTRERNMKVIDYALIIIAFIVMIGAVDNCAESWRKNTAPSAAPKAFPERAYQWRDNRGFK